MDQLAYSLLWMLLGFLAGAIPFSYWIGRLWLGTDIRQVGDGNPGATNVLRAGNKLAAATALLLDIAKGWLPVSLYLMLQPDAGIWLVPVALAPILGHALSPFLRGRGGKSVAVTGGVWAGLTTWEGPTVAGLSLALFSWWLGANGRAVLSAITLMLIYILITPPSWNGLITRPAPLELFLIGVGNLLIVAYKHRHDF